MARTSKQVAGKKCVKTGKVRKNKKTAVKFSVYSATTHQLDTWTEHA